MSLHKQNSTYAESRRNYTLRLVGPRQPNQPVIIEAVPTSETDYRWRKDSKSDAQFNLSSMIGNDNGQFKWGQASFEKSCKEYKLEQNTATGAFVLHGELLNLAGVYGWSTIDLDKHLTVKDYVDQGNNETYHRIMLNDGVTDKRSLVLCFDGTSNKFGIENTNVVKLVELLKKDNPERQKVYYQPGIGTYAPPGLMTNIGLAVAEKADEAAAWYLYQHVIDGYKFLMQSYKVGDSISIFGFSRGAFTARALAGMLHCVGLLPAHNIEQMSFAYDVYKNSKDVYPPDFNTKYGPNEVDPRKFKEAFSFEVKVDFVGVWDTVASVGAIWSQTLPWIDFNPSVYIFRQALALDERRGNFIPSVWDHQKTKHETQDVREVWFRGEHSNIGGGATLKLKPDGTPVDGHNMLSNIPLRWMIRQIIDCQTGILFDFRAIQRFRDKNVLEKPPTDLEAEKWDWLRRVKESIKLDATDITRELSDTMGWNPLWHALEYLPVTKPSKTSDYAPSTTRVPNAKCGRSIYCSKKGAPVFLHSSVVDYLKTNDTYKPRAKWYGYGSEGFPRVEDVYHNSGEAVDDMFPEFVRDKLDVDRPPPSEPKAGWFGSLFAKKKTE